MMRATRFSALRATATLLSNGITFPTGGTCSEPGNFNIPEAANTFSVNERGVKSSSQFPEPHTAVYDSAILPWTYFQPMKVNIEKLPAPEAKYYQVLTKKPWDVSSTEWVEIQYRKKAIGSAWYFSLLFAAYFLLPKEKSYSGLRGFDGWYILLPKNQSELFA